MNRITKLMTAAMLSMGLAFGATAQDPANMTRAEFAAELSKSVGHYGDNRGGWCTASKIGPTQWLTARHCVDFDTKIETYNGSYVFAQSVTLGFSKKSDNSRREDWAIVNVSQETPDIPALPLACGEEIYQGQDVAYIGFPAGINRGYFEGYISSVTQVDSRGNNGDYVIDMTVAWGASGSALVDRQTMQIVGVVTEGAFSRRTGFFATVAESVQNLDQCKAWNKRMKHWEKMDEAGYYDPKSDYDFDSADPDDGFVDWT